MARSFRYTRSILIEAPAQDIAPEIADLRRHVAWSPFSKPDPKVRETYSGEPGAGQSRAFAGGAMGAGAIRIDSADADRILMTLVMTRPVKATNVVEYTLVPVAGGTQVNWTLSGPMTWVGRIMGLFMDCEAMCGRMFDEGLAALKAEVESRRASRAA